jgi:Flp pilus assembly protein TadG
MRKRTRRVMHREDGQTLIMFVLFSVILLVFVGLGVDLGFAYITRSKLSKAVDAACLAGIRNLSQGTVQAGLIASNAFAANYGTSGRDKAPPALTINFGSVNGNTVLDVNASVSINTFFIRVMPTIGGANWNTLSVGETAESTRANLIMSLVLDVSGSMDPARGPKPAGDGTGSGGGTYLPNAVTTFINNFDDTNDVVAMVKFSTVQNNVVYGGSPSQPTKPFRNPIITAVNAFTWNGATFSQGGLTNALVLENNATVPPNENIIKVVVFFTDGLANVVQDSLNCSGSTSTLLNFGGQDTGTGYGTFDPTTGNNVSCGATQFKSQSSGGAMVSLNRANISADAKYRAIQVATAMRANKIIVYSIGCGSGVDATFLAQIANDPSAPGYVATSYDGEYAVASNPADLAAVFQTIASKILLRLSK